jgi:SAM-dependent methyltransferase
MAAENSQRSALWVYIVLVLILAAAWWMRSTAVAETFIPAPLRADALNYYSYAANLKYHGVYSNHLLEESMEKGVMPQPDADRNPGYALFLLGKVEYPATHPMMVKIMSQQALLDTVTVLLVFLLALTVVPPAVALLPALLTAGSPHLVSMTTYILTETMFAFTLTLAVLLGALALRKPSSRLPWLVFGAALAVTYLVKSSMAYVLLFAVPLLWFVFADKKMAKTALLGTVAGFLILTLPWEVRNQLNLPEGASTQASHAIISLHNGTYPGLMVNDDPGTRGFPHRLDPEYESFDTFPKVLKKLWDNTLEEPWKYFSWYAFGKPGMFFSWNMVSGQGDIFIYPAKESPYYSRRVFDRIHSMMLYAHWPVTLLALATVVFCWLPPAVSLLGGGEASVLRLASIPLLYLLALHVLTTPLPRYGIPLRPLVYLFFGAGFWCVSLAFEGRGREDRKLYAGWDPIGTCLSNWRVRAVQKLLPPGEHLDIACGDNRLVKTLGRGYGIDITAYPGVDITVKNFSSLPFKDESLDSASILAALNYFEAPEKTLQELHRSLKPGGVVVITLLSKTVSRYWHMLRDRGLPRITFDEEELRAIVSRTDLEWRSQSHFMLGLNRLIVLEKPA